MVKGPQGAAWYTVPSGDADYQSAGGPLVILEQHTLLSYTVFPGGVLQEGGSNTDTTLLRGIQPNPVIERMVGGASIPDSSNSK